MSNLFIQRPDALTCCYCRSLTKIDRRVEDPQQSQPETVGSPDLTMPILILLYLDAVLRIWALLVECRRSSLRAAAHNLLQVSIAALSLWLADSDQRFRV